MHNLINRAASGHGKWKQCLDCGATFHGRYWWLGGWKSKVEPPCVGVSIDEWKRSAEKLYFNEDIE